MIIYAAWLAYHGQDFGTLLKRSITEPVSVHLWYLYALVGLYAFTPIIAAYYQGTSRGRKLYSILPSLGIFCVHILVLQELGSILIVDQALLVAPWQSQSFAASLLLISAIIIWLMRRVPPLRLVT